MFSGRHAWRWGGARPHKFRCHGSSRPGGRAHERYHSRYLPGLVLASLICYLACRREVFGGIPPGEEEKNSKCHHVYNRAQIRPDIAIQ